ncbi:MAG: hypothetical protein SGJ09_05075 [Phycisphaerae bacterium]|nr:hypothetical protein [Phycisphaerae bacterium]
MPIPDASGVSQAATPSTLAQPTKMKAAPIRRVRLVSAMPIGPTAATGGTGES